MHDGIFEGNYFPPFAFHCGQVVIAWNKTAWDPGCGILVLDSRSLFANGAAVLVSVALFSSLRALMAL